MVNHLGYRASIKRDYGGSACHGFDHHQPKGLGPVYRKKQCLGVAKEISLVVFIYFAEEFHIGMCGDHGRDYVLPK